MSSDVITTIVNRLLGGPSDLGYVDLADSSNFIQLTKDGINPSDIIIGQWEAHPIELQWGGTNFVFSSADHVLLNKLGTVAVETQYNIFLGLNSLTIPLSSGTGNTGMGDIAGLSLTTGSSNTLMGTGTLTTETSGSQNTAIGFNALTLQATSSNNTALGYLAGASQASYTNCTFIGSGADASVNGLTNAIAIGYNASVGQNNSLILGNGAIVGIGTSTPNTSAILELSSTIGSLLLPRMTDTQRDALTAAEGMVIYDTTTSSMEFYNGSGWEGAGGGLPLITADNQVLTSGTGTAIWTSNFIQTSSNLFVGTNAGNETVSGNNNTAFGTGAENSLTSGGSNTAVGHNALNVETIGNQNTAVGFSALSSQNGSSNNTAVGYASQINMATGNFNCSLGSLSLTLEATGNNNTAMGYAALGSQNGSGGNVGIGYEAGASLTTGDGNTCVGASSLTRETTGISNCSFGVSSLSKQVGANQNNAFGVSTGLNITTGSDNCIYGFGSLGTESTGAENCAFGTQSLAAQTTSSGNSAFGYRSGFLQSSYTNCTFIGSGADASAGSLTNAIAIGHNASVGQSNSMILGNGVNVGIGTSTPNTSAILELASTTGALLLPRMTDTQRNALTAAAGMVIYDTTTAELEFYNGSTWVNGSGSGGTWIDQTSTPVTMAPNFSYVADNAGLVTLTLPATAAFGSTFNVTGKGAGGWKIAQNAGQFINFGIQVTTTGVGGSLASTNTFDSVTVVCVTANTQFVVYSSIGNLTVV